VSLLLADVKIRKQGSIGNVSSKFTKKEMQEWEEEHDSKGFRETRDEGRNKVDWIFNESSSISGSRKASARV
jgi:hypothetical protein